MACVGIWKGDLINFNCSSFSQLGHQEEKENSQPPISIKKNSVLNKKAIIIPNIHISDGGGCASTDSNEYSDQFIFTIKIKSRGVFPPPLRARSFRPQQVAPETNKRKH